MGGSLFGRCGAGGVSETERRPELQSALARTPPEELLRPAYAIDDRVLMDSQTPGGPHETRLFVQIDLKRRRQPMVGDIDAARLASSASCWLD